MHKNTKSLLWVRRKTAGARLRGASLIVVLASLAFLAALALAFLASVGTELKSSKNYAEGIGVQLLAQSAYNLAITQITEGTKGTDSSGGVLAWASQPGMIRTYDDSGTEKKFYRLYSWNSLIGSGACVPDDLTGWNTHDAVFTDINEPVALGGGKVFPIVDGNGIKSLTKTPSGTTVPAYFGYDADGDGQPDIDGFGVDPSKVNFVPANPLSKSNTPVPMPVKWLYMLQDGSITYASTTSNPAEALVNGATEDNPIVGRMAFWTDDESCKVNINTASEGVYWDTPRIKSRQEDVLKVNQPVNGEYQRYPGHPAMTSLSTVIKHPASWNPGTPVPTFSQGGVAFTLCSPAQWIEYQWAQKIYGIVPRVGTGGSNAGAVQSAMLASPALPPAIDLDNDRMYATLDELAFKPNRSSNNAELANLSVLNKPLLERAKFFLTASSRAPDVNLFNKPRVCIWPISNNTAQRTAYDNLMAFCSSMHQGSYTYYFERLNPNSPTVDLGLNRNLRILNYLRSLATQNIPGFGGNFSDKYGSDKDQIFTEIFDYIRCTNLRDPLLVNRTNEDASLSYSRGIPGSPWKNSLNKGISGMGQVVPTVDSSTNTRGLGRFETLEGASVLFIGQVDGDGPLVPLNASHQPQPPYPTAANTQVDPASGKPLPIYASTSPTAAITTPSVPAGKMRVQAIFLPQFFCPSVGVPWIRQNFQWSADLSKLKVNGNPLDFPSNVSAGEPKQYTVNQTPKDETGFGDQLGLNLPMQGASSNLLSSPMDIPKGTMSFSGEVTVKIYAADAVAAPPKSNVLLQTFVLNFNGPDCNVPSLAYDNVANKADNGVPKEGTIPYVSYRSFSTATGRYNSSDPANPKVVNGGRFTGSIATSNAGGFFMTGDSVRSVRLASGDPRLLACLANPPASYFEANPATDSLMGAHSFITGYGNSYYGAALGKLVKDLPYAGSGVATANQQTTADGPQNIFFNIGFTLGTDAPVNGVQIGTAPGDWDNGPFAVRDGPFINKADEGDVGGGSTTVSEPYFWKIKAQAGGYMPDSVFSPNRQVPSAVTFGSLPTGVKAGRPWQTLLFHPQPGHPGSKGYKGDGSTVANMPADHLILDLFHMPVVEPYAISEPLSTAGRINMNYQIMPFTYMNRDTGIRALLKAEKLIAIRDDQAGFYKSYRYSTPEQANIRLDINMDQTLRGFTKRFDGNQIFRSPSEICELYIVPVDSGSNWASSYDTMANYWSETNPAKGRRLTGDNSRERVYATLYPRLTTKSNTYTIHCRVQSLKKIKDSNPSLWTEGKDQILGQYRGYQTIERYVDANDQNLPDFTTASSTVSLGGFYKTRVIQAKQFAP